MTTPFLFKLRHTREKYINLYKQRIKINNFMGPRAFYKGITVNQWSYKLANQFIKNGRSFFSDRHIINVSKDVFYRIKSYKKVVWIVELRSSYQKPNYVYYAIKKNFFKNFEGSHHKKENIYSHFNKSYRMEYIELFNKLRAGTVTYKDIIKKEYFYYQLSKLIGSNINFKHQFFKEKSVYKDLFDNNGINKNINSQLKGSFSFKFNKNYIDKHVKHESKNTWPNNQKMLYKNKSAFFKKKRTFIIWKKIKKYFNINKTKSFYFTHKILNFIKVKSFKNFYLYFNSNCFKNSINFNKNTFWSQYKHYFNHVSTNNDYSNLFSNDFINKKTSNWAYTTQNKKAQAAAVYTSNSTAIQKSKVRSWMNNNKIKFKSFVFFQKTAFSNHWKSKALFSNIYNKIIRFKHSKMLANQISYSIKIVKAIDQETSKEIKFFIVTRNFTKSSFRSIFFDVFNVLSPYYKVYTQTRKRGKIKFQVFSKKPAIDITIRSSSIFNWIKNQVMKNPKYNHLVRNLKKARPKQKSFYTPKTSKRLTKSFSHRINNEVSKFFWLHSDVNNMLNEYNKKISESKFSKHFRWR